MTVMEEDDIRRQNKLIFSLYDYILKHVPENTFLECRTYLDMLKTERREGPGYPKEIFNWQIQNSDDDDIRILLTDDCKKFIIKNILTISNYLCHFVIRSNDKIYVVVFDGCHFDIDASIRIPREVIDECEREFEMDFSFSDHVRL